MGDRNKELYKIHFVKQIMQSHQEKIPKDIFKVRNKHTVVVHTFSDSTRKAEVGGSEFETCLVHRVSSRITMATLRNPVWKNQKEQMVW